MKYKKKMIGLVIILFGILFMTGCTYIGKPITVETFITTMEAEVTEYEIENIIDKFINNKNIEKAYTATNLEKEYQIQFYEFSDKNYAKNFYDYYVIEFNRDKIGIYSQTKIDVINYTAYALDSNGTYKVISRIDNSVILSVVESKYKKEIDTVLIKLGYMEDFDEYNNFFQTIFIIFSLIFLVSLWKIFIKTGKPRWAIFIPFYNIYLLAKITYGSGFMILLLFIPGINVFFLIHFFFRLAKVFGKSIWFGLGLCFLWPIFFPILAFNKTQYIGLVDNNS